MGKKPVMSLAGLCLVGLGLTGCECCRRHDRAWQTYDSPRLLSRASYTGHGQPYWQGAPQQVAYTGQQGVPANAPVVGAQPLHSTAGYGHPPQPAIQQGVPANVYGGTQGPGQVVATSPLHAPSSHGQQAVMPVGYVATQPSPSVSPPPTTYLDGRANVGVPVQAMPTMPAAPSTMPTVYTTAPSSGVYVPPQPSAPSSGSYVPSQPPAMSTMPTHSYAPVEHSAPVGSSGGNVSSTVFSSVPPSPPLGVAREE